MVARIAVLVTALYVSCQLHAQLPPVFDYVTYPAFDSARLSPDGEYIAMAVSGDTAGALVIRDAATLRVTSAYQIRGDFTISEYQWANAEQVVFATARSNNDYHEVAATGNLYVLSVDGTQRFGLAGPVTGERAFYRLLDAMDSERGRVMVTKWMIDLDPRAANPMAFPLNISRTPNGTYHPGSITSPLAGGELLTDNDARVRLAWAANADGNFTIRLLQNDVWFPVPDFPGAADADPGTGVGRPLGFNSDNSGIYHLTRSPRGTIGIALFDVASRQSHLLYAHDKYDVTIGNLVRSADGKDVIGATVMGALPEIHYFADHPDTAFHRSLDNGLPGHRINFLNFTDDGRKGLALVSAPTLPPALFMLDRDQGTFSPLFSSMPGIQDSPMMPAELISFMARDGTPLEGYLTQAAGVEGPAPLIVLVHDGPHGARDGPVFNAAVKLLSSRGYSVLQINYRGSGGYGLAFQQAGYRNWGKAMVDDVIDGTEYVVAQGRVDAERMCIMGSGYGGYAAMMALVRYPDRYQCGVSISGLYDLNLIRRSEIPFLPGSDAFLDTTVGSDAAELAAHSPVALARNIKASVFLAYGRYDERLSPAHADDFKAALRRARVDYSWFYMRRAGHVWAPAANREELYTALFEFLSGHL